MQQVLWNGSTKHDNTIKIKNLNKKPNLPDKILSYIGWHAVCESLMHFLFLSNRACGLRPSLPSLMPLGN